jgi:hypothetical protein
VSKTDYVGRLVKAAITLTTYGELAAKVVSDIALIDIVKVPLVLAPSGVNETYDAKALVKELEESVTSNEYVIEHEAEGAVIGP